MMNADYLPMKITKDQQELIAALNRDDYVSALRIIVRAMDDYQNSDDPPTPPGAATGGE